MFTSCSHHNLIECFLIRAKNTVGRLYCQDCVNELALNQYLDIKQLFEGIYKLAEFFDISVANFKEVTLLTL
jgi:transcription elongation factor Elf1